MPHEVIMPALGMAQDTGLLVAWLKAPGDAVAVGDVLFEVETDKSTMEVEAQADGFLTDVSAKAGEDIPVGQVIAMISQTPDVTASAPASAAPPAAASDIPEGQIVIMPALGMAQDTGLIVAWHKAPGDAVTPSDILFEVETDKSTMEVEAGFEGFVAALLAEAGEEAPVGETIAVISTAKPANPVQRSRAKGTPAPAPATPAASTASKPATPATPAKSKPTPAQPVATDGRILASPKARRLALEQGLDLSRLIAAGHPQPYRVSDLEVLKALPTATPAGAAIAASRHLVAHIASDGFAEFARWAADAAGQKDPGALLAGLVAGSSGKAHVVAVERFGQIQTYTASANLRAAALSDDAPELLIRDLRGSRIATVRMGAETTPVLTIASAPEGFTITLECAEHQLGASEAITLLSNFAGRMEQPLRHLL
ncbi:biotin/lipoyl-containing protein [Pseudothioclava nitratireducens]|uniref:biotin/lipoyl-containing protein n=1 Tax=Pseudothioclava nitratireducens TaxID=1928646 RepID=UPI0023DC9A73|nr:biotin/lipoyl-containing protein [Defluviimonas nitratireducens]MDF1621734.1 pyruvate dehydrogenase [Defluviimonas nitratireducens]